MAIFKTLFELRLKAHNRPHEDYLTEILKFVLSRDIDLLNHFLNYFSIIDNKIDEFEITSQLSLKKLIIIAQIVVLTWLYFWKKNLFFLKTK